MLEELVLIGSIAPPESLPLAACCRLDLLEEPAGGRVDAAGGDSAWDEVAREFLGPAEREEWRALTRDRRRREWLLGRLAAKEAIRRYLRAAGIPDEPAAGLEIVSDAWGRPILAGAAAGRIAAIPSLSLTHTDGVAAAIAVAPPGGVGIDIERVARRRGDYARAAFNPEERSIADRGDAAARDESLLRLWCAKEAVAKAIGRGLMGSPRNLEIRDADDALQRLTVVVAGSLERALPFLSGVPLTACVLRDGDLIVAIAGDAPTPLALPLPGRAPRRR